jgi:uncharacterized protein (DUF58 family)
MNWPGRLALRRYFLRYLERKQPPLPALTLTQQRIYILPSRLGWWFAVLVILLYLLGTNYQNNLIILCSFMLLSLLLLTMLQTFYNLFRLKLAVVADAQTYADTAGTLPLKLQSRDCRMLQLGLYGQKLQQLLPNLQGEQEFSLQLPVLARGCYSLPRLRLSSQFPFGLFHCWSYPALSAQLWVYPAPQPPTHSTPLSAEDPGQQRATPQTDADQVKPYQAGDLPSRILWKKLATHPEQPVVRQIPLAPARSEQWVQVPALTGPALEQALSMACYQLQQLEAMGSQYGLMLPGKTLALGRGPSHLTRCLQELALC